MKHDMKEALRLSFPVMVGYIFLGIAFGLLCEQQGYSCAWAFLISCSVYAGSMQFVLLTFFHAGFSLVEVAFVTLSVNARQIFYGLSFLNDFALMGKKKWYMMFSLTDETYSLLCAISDRQEPHGQRLMFLISLFNHGYWVLGSMLGATIGMMITFDTKGIDFAMTALFTVILVEQCISAERYIAIGLAVIAVSISVIFFGFANFLLPALIMLVVLLILCKKKAGGKL